MVDELKDKRSDVKKGLDHSQPILKCAIDLGDGNK
jgi:hypothetical protein